MDIANGKVDPRATRYLLVFVIFLSFIYTVLISSLSIHLGRRSPSHPPRFYRDMPEFNMTGPTVNPVPREVRWYEDLGQEPTPICNETHPFILAVVPSAVHHFEARQRVRNTWANPKYYPYTGLRAIFVLGATTNDTLQELVREEIACHRDIIQNTFIDSYRNLTYKSISWLSWVNDWCLDTPYIAKVDDDVIVNPFSLYRALEIRFQEDPSPSQIFGMVEEKYKPLRDGKWNVSTEEYPEEYYPTFVLGPAYIVGRNAVEKLLDMASHTPLLWLEDVYITGLVAGAAGVERVQIYKLFTRHRHRKIYRSSAFLTSSSSPKRKQQLWESILKFSKCCRYL